jgi:hypothetical protein
VGRVVRSQPDVSEEPLISTSGSNGKLSNDRSEAGSKLSSSDPEEADKFLRTLDCFQTILRYNSEDLNLIRSDRQALKNRICFSKYYN